MKKLSVGLGFLVLAFLFGTIPAAFAEEGEKDLWTGPYVGLVFGMGDGGIQETPDFGRNQAEVDGGVFGALVGYNRRVGGSNLILGVEADVGKANISGSRTEDLCPGCVVSDVDTTETTIQWLNTFRGRIGYDMGRTMPYVTAGAVYGEVKTSIRNERRFGALVQTSNSWAEQAVLGYTLGAGMEYAATKKVTIGIEWLNLNVRLLDVADNFSARDVVLSGNIARASVKMSF